MRNSTNSMIISDVCDCEECKGSEHPCAFDCSDCIGCKESQEERKDILYSIDEARGLY